MEESGGGREGTKVSFSVVTEGLNARKRKASSSIKKNFISPLKFARTYHEWIPLQVLPSEMLFKIFEFLPLKDRCCMSLVCWYWKSLIDETLWRMTTLDLSQESPLKFPSPFQELIPDTNRMNAVVTFFANKCKRLRCINLEGCQELDGDSIHQLLIGPATGTPTKPSLKAVYLAQCQVKEDTLRHLGEKCKKRLKHVDLYQCSGVSESAVVDLLKKCSGGLRYLNICGIQRNLSLVSAPFSRPLLRLLMEETPRLHTLYMDTERLETGEKEKLLSIHPTVSRYGRFVSNNYLYIGQSNEKGEMHGVGRLLWNNGSHYEGDFREGRMHGTGTWHWENGRSYSGGWANGQMEGEGIYVGLTGERYVGTFSKGKKHGKGQRYTPEGIPIAEEEWVHGALKRKKSNRGEEKRKQKRDYHRRISKPAMF